MANTFDVIRRHKKPFIFVIRRFVGIKFSLEIIVDFYREAFVHIRKIIKR
jgi:hypothetical protein